ncbi:MAG TPA: hypothetical protein VK808_02630 [Bacteroidia bacterium]|nr:hypothetical protein [Bacteroidia bacterium]
MKKVSLCLIPVMSLVFHIVKADSLISYSDRAYAPPDSNKLIQLPISETKELNMGEVFFTPGIGYGNMAIEGSPLSNSIFVNNYNYNGNTYSAINYPEFGGSLDYMVSPLVCMGIGVNYQLIRFDLSTNYQNAYINPYYNEGPNSALFSRLNIGIRNLFYFKGINSDNLHIYVGARAGLSIWYEWDSWANGVNYNYRSVINSNSNDNGNIQMSIQLLWGMRYFFTHDLGMQLELGLGTPYYAQFGITYRFNDNPVTYSVTRSEYRAMNEGTQLTHRDSANLGLLPMHGMKK